MKPTPTPYDIYSHHIRLMRENVMSRRPCLLPSEAMRQTFEHFNMAYSEELHAKILMLAHRAQWTVPW